MEEERITLKARELKRYEVIKRVLRKEVRQESAAALLELTSRQLRNLMGRVREQGAKGLVHGNRGKPSPRKMSEARKERIVMIMRSRYPDFPPLLGSEKLREREGIEVSRETLRQIMLEVGLWKRRRRKRDDYIWRERKAQVGEMVQMDGSHHAWLEERGPRLVLMGYVDDATGRFYGRFYDHEGVWPAMDSFRGYIARYGLPQSLYLDRHSTYKTSRGANTEEALRGEKAKTQFEMACGELGVMVIHARTPQAKGRVERVFRTLQGRLVREMRLGGIRDLDRANRFLEDYVPEFNERFMKAAREAQDLHRPLPKSVVLEDILCLKDIRTILDGYLVKWGGRIFVLQSPSLSVRRQKVLVLEDKEGRIRVRYKGRDLEIREVHQPPPVRKTQPVAPLKPPVRRKYTPPPDHPWRHTGLF